jgi:uncharacterized protein YceH (UPF0502 family)
VLCVLMLRGPQTPGELKQRSERMHAFPDLPALRLTLDRLIERGLVRRLDRRPGHKEERYIQLLGDPDAAEPAATAIDPTRATDPADDEPRSSVDAGRTDAPDPAGPPPSPRAPSPELVDLRDRVARLERDVAALREALGEV